jgi:ABC-2 type transport system permease protein
MDHHMRKLFATMAKEFLVLLRDRPALLVLFLMPSLLVIVITLVQESAMTQLGHPVTHILLVDEDGRGVGREVETMLRASEGVEIVPSPDGGAWTSDTAKNAVVEGKYPLCAIVPRGMTEALRARARQSVEWALSGRSQGGGPLPGETSLTVIFDPAAREAYRSVLTNALRRIASGLETRERAEALKELLPERISEEITKAAGPYLSYLPPGFLEKASRIDVVWTDSPILRIQAGSAGEGGGHPLPTSTQQNVPAWALFGMFFVAMPISGALIRERVDGIILRLSVAPASAWPRLLGTLLTYALVCMAQFALVFLIGKALLPHLGVPSLELGRQSAVLVLIALSASLAACGFGILMGTLARSYQQASAFGPLAIVISGALGGIMVPDYLIPAGLKMVGNLFPLAWGQKAFQGILVRGGDLSTIWPQLSLLLFFSAGTLLSAVGITLLRERRGLWRDSTLGGGF